MAVPRLVSKLLTKLTPRTWALLVSILFAVLGVAYLGQSNAATFVAKSEAEAGTVKSPAATATDSAASGGSAVRFSAGTPTPTPPTPTPPTPTPTPGTPTTWPSGWDDPRFTNMTNSGPRFNSGSSVVTWQNLSVANDNSGQVTFGYGNYNLLNSRMRTREGPRISGSNILIQDSYIEVASMDPDHGDGIQAYHCFTGQANCTNTNFTNVVVRRTTVVLKGTSALNAGIFLADHSGVDLTLDTVFVDGGAAPNGALFFANSGVNNSDKGCNSLTLRHVRVKPKVRFETNGCNILEWTDVAYENGTPIPRPN